MSVAKLNRQGKKRRRGAKLEREEKDGEVTDRGLMAELDKGVRLVKLES